MTAYSSILAWSIPWTGEPGPTVHGVVQLDTTEMTLHGMAMACLRESYSSA